MFENKRGTHVGVVLSFVIFITFLLFLLNYLIPEILNQNSEPYAMESLKNNLLENVSDDLKIITLKTNDVSSNCIRLVGFVGGANVDSRIIIKNDDGEKLTSYILSNDLEIIRNSTNKTFFKVYHSEHFSQVSDVGEGSCDIGVYEISSTKEDKYVFEKKVISLIDFYENNYTTLKSSLKIPEVNEFSFSFRYLNGTTIQNENKTIQGNVFAVDVPVNYVDSYGDILLGFINIRLW